MRYKHSRNMREVSNRYWVVGGLYLKESLTVRYLHPLLADLLIRRMVALSLVNPLFPSQMASRTATRLNL